MAHNAITRILRQAFFAAIKEDEEGLASFNEWSESRRKFLKQAVIAATGTLLAPPLLSLSSCHKQGNNDIVIIGAGIAGLNAAYQLQKKGIKSTIYESSGRIGGRMFTLNDEFGKGITTEVGGEFVDTTHSDIIQLVKELGLSFYDLRQDPLARKTLHFGGRDYSEDDLKQAIKPFVSRLIADIKSLPKIISYQAADQFKHLDEQSVTGYLTSIGVKGWLFDFLNVTLTREYGMEASQQSAVNFLIMFEPPSDAEKGYQLFGSDHEVFKIKGGSAHLTDTLYEKVKSSVKTGYRLTRILNSQQQGYDLEFQHQGSTAIVNAKQVIIAIPFTMLRTIDFNVPMPEGKRKCINEIGYGNSSKLFIGVSHKPWRETGSQGYTFTDLSFGCGWDSSQMQSDKEGSFTVFAGGNFSDRLKNESAQSLTESFLSDFDTIFPGMDKAFNQKTSKFYWPDNPESKAAYSSFKVGQWSTLAGWEKVPVGEIYFAGEHTSSDFQGYMNGAAQTGRMAAEAIIKSMVGSN
ncbi:NAD(P)/FAD-dependent oxidoreductase [Mucilaginibacter sp. BT774]|uniref:flavin monoamine oxidase family protein n=1 Tax=Mucilaginibacter sp. BT774 TaxID=3062276 RepID=UPI0026744916|nr:NAD(P)/FAD-dependent oxidoreductase [Mucilaginibacter sp. BT774]MDO3628974.1 NAD(P)/FAD-dependent oxidoreductase [Mucilaginibacter sp. BT774]